MKMENIGCTCKEVTGIIFIIRDATLDKAFHPLHGLLVQSHSSIFPLTGPRTRGPCLGRNPGPHSLAVGLGQVPFTSLFVSLFPYQRDAND